MRSSLAPFVKRRVLPKSLLLYKFTEFETLADGSRGLANICKISDPKNIISNSGQGIYLNGIDQSVEVPINATLGAELIAPITATSFIGNGNTDVSKSGDIVTMTAKADGSCYMYLSFRTSAIGTIADGSNALCSFNYVSVGNDASFDIYTGYGQPHMKVNSGEFVFVYSDTTTHYYRYNMNNAKLGDTLKVDTSKISIKEITAVQGSVTVFDHATKTFEQPTLPLATTYTLKDGTFGTIIKLDTNTFSQADLDAFTAEPELVIDWYFGVRTIPSGIIKGADDKVYACLEGGSTLHGLDAIPTLIIANHTASVRDTTRNTPYGLQKLRLELNGTNVPTAVVADRLVGGNDGRNLLLPLDTPQNHIVTKDIKDIAGDSSSLTITYEDNTTVVVP